MSEIPTNTANDINEVDDKIRYDQQVKKVLANRQILARICRADGIQFRGACEDFSGNRSSMVFFNVA